MEGIISQNAIQMAQNLIKEGEGLRLTVYKDTKKYQTIGYGHKLLPEEIGQLVTITEEKASELLEQDMKTAINTVKGSWQNALGEMNDERKAVLIDMTYNLGSLKWVKFTAAIKNKDWNKAAVEIMDSEYARQVKDRAKRNACIMRDGQLYSKLNQNWV